MCDGRDRLLIFGRMLASGPPAVNASEREMSGLTTEGAACHASWMLRLQLATREHCDAACQRHWFDARRRASLPESGVAHTRRPAKRWRMTLTALRTCYCRFRSLRSRPVSRVIVRNYSGHQDCSPELKISYFARYRHPRHIQMLPGYNIVVAYPSTKS